MFDSSRALVLDANILIRAVLGKRVRLLIEQYATQVFLCTPDLCFVEAERYLPEIIARRGKKKFHNKDFRMYYWYINNYNSLLN
jgi:hypothetical protein